MNMLSPRFLKGKAGLFYFLAGLLTLATLFTPSPIYSQDNDGNNNGQDPAMEHKGDPAWDMVAAYAQGFQISYEEAQARLDLQDQLGYLTEELEEKDPAYGGAWIEHEPEYSRCNVTIPADSYHSTCTSSNMESEFGYLSGELYNSEPAYGGSWIQREPEYGFYVQFTVPNGEEILQRYVDRYPFIDQIHVSQSQYSHKGLEAIKDVLWPVMLEQPTLINATGIGVYAQNITIFVYSEDPVETERTITGNQELLAAMAAGVNEPEPEQILNVLHFEYGEQPVPINLPLYRVFLPIAAVQ